MIPVGTKLNHVMNGKLKGLCCRFKVMNRQTIKRLSGGMERGATMVDEVGSRYLNTTVSMVYPKYSEVETFLPYLI